MKNKIISSTIGLLTAILIDSAFLFAQSEKFNNIHKNQHRQQFKMLEQMRVENCCLTPGELHVRPERINDFRLFEHPIYEKCSPINNINKPTLKSWVSLGPEGGWIETVLMHPTDHNILFAQAQGNPTQIYKSTNSGATWELISRIPTTLYDFALDPNNSSILYGVNGNNIYKSEDGGSTWTNYQIDTKWFNNPCIHVCPTNSNVIYIGASYYSNNKSTIVVYKSTNGGMSWTPYEVLPSNYRDAYCQCFAGNPQDTNELYVGGYYYDNMDIYYAVLFKSTDGGVNWADKSNGLESLVYDIVIDPASPDKIYACNYYNIYRSQDGGSNWYKNNGRAYAYKLVIDRQNTNIIYGGEYYCIFKSTDGGINWQYYSNGLKGQCNTILVDHTTSSQLYYGSTVGVFKSSNRGSDWSAINSGIVASRITAMGMAPGDPRTIYLEFEYDAVYKTINSGNDWTKLPEFTSCGNIGAIAVNNTSSNIAYALEESG